LLLNTCSIREKAQDKVFHQLGRWRKLKAKNPGLKIGVGGCVASQEGEAIIVRAPFVDVIFGPQTLHRLPELIALADSTKKPQVDISFPEIEKFDCLPEPSVDGPSAFVSIMEGCSKYCSFCVVPYTRGEEFSRPFDDVITEIYALAGKGVREIVLLGQNVNAYRGAMTGDDGEELFADLALLINYVAAIDGTHHTLDTDDLVIADASRAVAVAGVMGGAETEVGSTTRRILLESAWFDPVPVRSTSRRLGLASDSSYRFERRVDIDAADIASRRFFHLLCRETDCKVLSGCWEAMRDGLLDPPAEVPIRLDRTELILGEAVPAAELTRVLSALGFQHSGGDDARSLWVPPTWRADCTREIDLIEEVGRIHGLDRVPDRQMAVRVVPEDRDAGLVERVKALLEGTGHHESLTFSFGSEGDHRELEEWWCLGDPWVVRNPVRSNEGVLRRSLLPGLLSCVRGNRLHGVESVRLFEVARVFHRRDGVDRPVEKIHLAWVHSNADESRKSEAYRQVRGIADAVLELLRLGTESRSASTWNPVSTSCGLARGSCAALDFFSERLGLVGAAPLDGVTGETWCGELDLGTLIGHSEVKHRYREFSRHPGVRRDLNIVVEESVLWRDIASEVDAAEMANFEGLTFLDVYRGKQVTQGQKSVTFSVAFRASDRSLTHEEVDEAIEGLMQRLSGRFQARLRT